MITFPKRWLSWAVIAAVLAASVAPLSAATYYVRKSGNDANAGTSSGAAFQTIERARFFMQKGDVCYVGAGTYTETIRPARDGDANNPIRFIADTSGMYTGDSGSVILASATTWCVEGNGADHNQFLNFTFEPTTSGALLPVGIYVYKCQNFALINCTLRNLQVGIFTEECDAAITDCRFENIGTHAIQCLKKNVTVTGTTITGSGSYAAFHTWSGSTDDTLTMRNCTITNNHAGPYVNNTRLVLDNCTIEQNSAFGAAVVDGKFSAVNMTRGIRFNGGGLFLSQATVPDIYYNGDDSITDGGPDHHVITGLDLSDNVTYGLYSSNCNIRLLNCKIENTQGYALGLAQTELRDATGTIIRNNAHGIIGWTNPKRKKLKIDKLTMSNNAGNALVLYGDAAISDDKLELLNSNISGHAGWACYVEHANIVCKSTRLENNASGMRLWQPTSASAIGKCELDACVIAGVTQSDAIYAHYANVTVKNSTLRDSQRSGVQGYYGSLTVENTSITNVGQTEGYAVYHFHPGPVASGSPVTKIKASTITGNDAGVYADRTHLELDTVTLANNRSWALAVNYGNITWSGTGAKIVSNNGRGMYVAGNTLGQTERRFDGWQFVDNGDYGIYAANCKLVLKDCIVQRMAGWGLGIAYATFEPLNTPITNNGKGVAVYSDADQPPPVLRNVVVTNNRGTAIMHESVPERPATAMFQNCTVTLNQGWGLLGQFGSVDCQGSTFDDNTNGIYLEHDPATAAAASHFFKYTVIRDVTGSDALYCSGASLRLELCTIENIARGGVHCLGKDLTAAFCTVTNTGTTEGYAVYHHYPATDALLRGQTRLENCSITGNDNGPYAHYTDLTMDDCTITGNRRWAVLSAFGELLVGPTQRAIHGNGRGLYVVGNPSNDCRVLDGWNVTNNDSYGIYAVDCDLQLNHCVIEQMADWGMGVENATVIAVNSPVRNNGRGIEIRSSPATREPTLTDVEVALNSGVGIQHTTDPASPRTLHLVGGLCYGNGGEALLSQDADLACTGTRFENNARGLHLVKSATARGQGGHRLIGAEIVGNLAAAGLYSEYADVELINCILDQNAGHGVACLYGDLLVDSSTCSGHTADGCYGIYHFDQQAQRENWAGLIVRDSTLVNNFGGLYADHTNATVNNAVIENNQAWGIGCAHGELNFVNQQRAVNHNGSGLLVIGNTDGAARYLQEFDVSENGNYGVFAVDCDLVLDHCQVHDMQGWGLGLSNASLRVIDTPIENNGNGIHVQTQQGERETVLEDVYIRNSQGYAVYHESPEATPGMLRLRNCRLEDYGQYGLVSTYGAVELSGTRLVGDASRSENGVYLLDAPQATIDRSTILGHLHWGLLSYGTPVLLRNSVVAQNDGGMYFQASLSAPIAATIVNSTLAENRAYGLVQHRGTTTLINNIIATTAAGSVGVQVTDGDSSHGYNLLAGYVQPWVGTSSGTGDVLGSPRFVNAAAGDFHLLGSSMAINRGTDLPGQTDVDLDGHPRPMFGKWEMGAFEYTNPSESAHVVEWEELK